MFGRLEGKGCKSGGWGGFREGGDAGGGVSPEAQSSQEETKVKKEVEKEILNGRKKKGSR